MAKEYCSNNDQIRKLKSRGMIISNPSDVKCLLEYGNYFVIINGYKELFIDNTYTGPDEKYKNGTKFEEIFSLYEFDRELRSLFLKNILLLENSIKSIISRVFSAKYGHDNYLRISYFDSTTPVRRNQTQSQKVGDIIQLISSIQSDISQQLQKQNPMIVHYQMEYGFIPLWVLVNILSLGTMSKFYQYMYQTDQNDVGRKYGLKPREMISFLNVLTLFRNNCAHDGRLYNFYSHRRIVIMPIHSSLAVPPAGPSGNLTCAQQDLCALVIIFRQMLKKKEYHRLFFQLETLINNLSSKIQTISISDVLNAMGFPPNWKDLKR